MEAEKTSKSEPVSDGMRLAWAIVFDLEKQEAPYFTVALPEDQCVVGAEIEVLGRRVKVYSFGNACDEETMFQSMLLYSGLVNL